MLREGTASVNAESVIYGCLAPKGYWLGTTASATLE